MAVAPLDLRARFDAAPMSGTQVAAVAVTVALSALDGYDVLSVTFAAPAIAQDWGVGKVRWAYCCRRDWAAWRSARWCWRRSPTWSGAGEWCWSA